PWPLRVQWRLSAPDPLKRCGFGRGSILKTHGPKVRFFIQACAWIHATHVSVTEGHVAHAYIPRTANPRVRTFNERR
ncbi:MAG: hypothetical protein OXI37_01180, partial [Gammaproteobacteria bacterium]|nr:hypothetical protein [Gammaproteobacteria bacterium]